MKITYDPRQNVAYIRLREKRAEVETLRISGELNIDISKSGRIAVKASNHAGDEAMKAFRARKRFCKEFTGL